MKNYKQEGIESGLRLLSKIRAELNEMESLLKKKPIDDFNLKAAFLIKATELYMFDINNGMLKVAKELSIKANECVLHNGTLH